MLEVSDRFLWVKIDIDEEKELAARYRVSGVPHTTVLNEKNRVLGGQAGYLTAGALIAFLETSLLNPPQVDPIDDLLDKLAAAADDEARRAATAGVIEALASSDRGDRLRLVEALTLQGPAAWPVLLDKMSDPRLAVRAAAGHSLGYITRAPLSFHPFASVEQRTSQLEQWRHWTNEQNR
jgi:thioredoxin-like negative regulator of GroEL